MSKIIALQYNGELGYSETIENVVKNVFKIYGISTEEFLDFTNDFTPPFEYLSNRELVYQHYSLSEKVRYGLAKNNGDILKDYKSITPQMRCPYINFYIDSKYVTINNIINNSSLLVNDFSMNTEAGFDDGTNYNKNTFFKNYIDFLPKITKVTPDTEKLGTRRQYLNPKVWLWSKSLNEDGKFNNNSIFDLSPFIENLQYSNSETGGNFSINLLTIEGMIDVVGGVAKGIWSPKKNRYVKFKQENKFNYVFKNILNARFNKADEYPQYDDNVRDGEQENPTSMYDTQLKTERVDVVRPLGNEKSISSDLFFKNLISENDIIFITFRDNEDDDPEKIEDFFVSNKNLVGQNWEMIGLVDRNNVGVTYEGSEFSSSISGRDCMKLLIEDGSYFFANSYSDEDHGIFDNAVMPNRGDGVNSSNQVIQNGQKSANRLFMTGMLDVLFNAEARNVHFIMNLLISRLSNVDICHDRLFEYYGEKRTKFSIPNFELIKR
jgi:hypothetical protein